MANQKIIFLHIPKSGGSSFKTFLKRNFNDREIIGVNWSSWFRGVNDLIAPPPTRQGCRPKAGLPADDVSK